MNLLEVPMALIDKESLMPVPTEGKRRSKRLHNESDSVQLQSATLEVKDPDGDVHHFIQVKFWTKERQWTTILFDHMHDIVALAGPRKREDDCWKDIIRILTAKGYWAE
jgi:hypothetical protein